MKNVKLPPLCVALFVDPNSKYDGDCALALVRENVPTGDPENNPAGLPTRRWEFVVQHTTDGGETWDSLHNHGGDYGAAVFALMGQMTCDGYLYNENATAAPHA